MKIDKFNKRSEEFMEAFSTSAGVSLEEGKKLWKQYSHDLSDLERTDYLSQGAELGAVFGPVFKMREMIESNAKN